MKNIFSEVKQTLFISAGLTAAIILACYLIFDVHIVNRVRGWLGLHCPALVILDEVPTPLYFSKVLPYSKQADIPIGTFVHEYGVTNWQAMSGKTIKESLAEGVEAVPLLKTLSESDVVLEIPFRIDEKIAKEKQFFAQAGLNTDYFGYSWIHKQAELSRPFMPKYCKAAVYYPGGYNSYNEFPIKDRYMMTACIAGNGKTDWANDAFAYIDSVNQSDSLGILVIQSWHGQQFTDAEFERFKEAIHYAKSIGVKIVTLREAIRQ